MLPPYYFYWFRIYNKHVTEPWSDQALSQTLPFLQRGSFQITLTVIIKLNLRGLEAEEWRPLLLPGRYPPISDQTVSRPSSPPPGLRHQQSRYPSPLGSHGGIHSGAVYYFSPSEQNYKNNFKQIFLF